MRNGCADTDGNGYGGAIRTRGPLTLAEAVADGNRSAKGAGAIEVVSYFAFTVAVSISDSTLSNNFAAESGGAIRTAAGTSTTIARSTIAGNSAGIGEAGGILNFGSLTLVNSSVVDNTARGGGGGGIVNRGWGRHARARRGDYQRQQDHRRGGWRRRQTRGR